jgi:hypothetical protein
LNFNFSSSGGDHSLSMETVLDAKDLAQEGNALGAVIGTDAGRITFSDGRLQELAGRFKTVKKTVKKDGRTTRIFREATHVTALALKSHCFVVRGSQSHPKDQSGTIIMPYFSECANSPVPEQQKFPERGPSRKGGVVRIGNVFNEESSVTSVYNPERDIPADGIKTSLVYQSGKLKENLCYNLDSVSRFYRDFPDYANYELRFGYTLKEAKAGLAKCGIFLRGLPDTNENILFEESGTLDAIISNIANKFGYYWYINPFATGDINFINSAAALTLPPLNPFKQSLEEQKKYISASFTEDSLYPVFVNAFSGSIEKQEQSFEFDQGERLTRFRKVPFSEGTEEAPNAIIKNLLVNESILKVFYTMYLAGAYNEENFDIMAIVTTRFLLKKIGYDIDWQDTDWNGANSMTDARTGGVEILTGIARSKKKLQEGGDLNLDEAEFIQLKDKTTGKKIERPSQGNAFRYIKAVLDVLHNTIYVSNFYSKYSARRTSWTGSEMNISGPFSFDKKFSEIESLASASTVWKALGWGEGYLDDLMKAAGSKGSGAYGFIGQISGANRATYGMNKSDLDFELFNSKEYRFEATAVGEYLGISPRLKSQIINLAQKSIELYNDQNKFTTGPQTARAYFTRSKRPTDEEDNDKTRRQEEAQADRQAGLDAAAQKIAELAERFDTRYYSLQDNGSNGNLFRPITLDIKSGKIADIIALEESSLPKIQSTPRPQSQSSRTILGVSLPGDFKPTITAITLDLGESGATTTINESSVKLLRPSEQLIIDRNQKAALTSIRNTNFTATQKNFLGL